MAERTTPQRISDCGKEIVRTLLPLYTSEDGKLHPQTVIAARARMAGTYAFRSVEAGLSGLRPGQAVLSPQTAPLSPLLLRTCAAVLAQLGTQVASAPAGPLDAAMKQSREDLAQTQRRLQTVLAPLMRAHALGPREMGQAAAVATGMLIHATSRHLKPDEGFAVAAVSFAQGTQTVPEPEHPQQGAAG